MGWSKRYDSGNQQQKPLKISTLPLTSPGGTQEMYLPELQVSGLN
ncbi:Uncharacterized [Syntrophomonas zehnderi OL-4]|uniref:Uncharacterized n=1 Tax=Syntrophomonas zehnderi OL-4 TaxID=690567 RepID=A0A0E4C7V8_9FIRM|nr:Uncharacterized [Syntrophomonas zehnderi OL-4]